MRRIKPDRRIFLDLPIIPPCLKVNSSQIEILTAQAKYMNRPGFGRWDFNAGY
jgi:hypothetical protein